MKHVYLVYGVLLLIAFENIVLSRSFSNILFIMPGTRCTVAVCNNSLVKTRKYSDANAIMYHSFPKDPNVRKQWIHRCRRGGKWNPNSCLVCSEHFTADDYERDLKAELLNLPQKRKLKPAAIPSQKLEYDSQSKDNFEGSVTSSLPADRKIRKERREDRNLVKEILNTSDIVEESDNEVLQSTISIKEYEELFEKYTKLQTKHKLLRKKHKQQIRKLRDKIKNQHISLLKARNQNKIIREKLGEVFTKNQVDILMRKKKRLRWTSDDISNAVTLRCISKRAYIYLRSTLKFPLPAISTLQQWASNIVIRQGLIKDVLKLIRIAAVNMEEKEKIAIIQFDEMKIKKIYEYDEKFDQILGPFTQMQVVMVRGLFANWKQPIFIDFDCKMSTDIFSLIVKELGKIGITVVACVSDMGGANVGFWKKINIDHKQSWYKNPYDQNKKIHFFADVPHLLKLLRNWLLDTGFILKDKTEIKSAPLQELLELDNHELKICHKLKNIHIECKGTQRQNVRLAAEVFSHTTATALKCFFRSEDAKNLSDFLKMVNDWFDVMNSYVPDKFGFPAKSGYGMHNDQQVEILDKMYSTISGMRCCGKKGLQMFQKGILISIISLKNLFDDMKDLVDVSFILTHRLNQDSLENLFSQIRSRGGLNDHPTPLNALYRVRMIVMGRSPGLIQSNLNTENSNSTDETYIVANVLEQVGLISSEKVLRNNNSSPMVEDIVSQGEIAESSLEIENNISDEVEFLECATDVEESAQTYLCGWVARKFKKKYPNLGSYTYQSESNTEKTWIEELSFGGLMKPENEFLKVSRSIEEKFIKYHPPKDLIKTSGVVCNLLEQTCKSFPEIPKEVLKSYIKMRTIIRMRYLNSKLKKIVNISHSPDVIAAGDENRKKKRKLMKIIT